MQKSLKLKVMSGSPKSWLQEFYRVQDCVNIQLKIFSLDKKKI